MIDRAANVKAFYVLSWIDTVFSKKKKKANNRMHHM